MSNYLPHQVRAAKHITQVIKDLGMAYLAGAPRSGKTRTAIHVAEHSHRNNILVLTKKNAISGWHKELNAVQAQKHYTVTNYEQAAKLKDEYDFCIIDEAHNMGRVGRPSQRFQAIRLITWQTNCLLLSGTPSVESPGSLYYQFGVCKHTPFRQKSFYQFFNRYGISNKLYIGNRKIEQYNQYTDDLMPTAEPYFVRMTQQDAGIDFKKHHKIHTVKLSDWTKDLIEQALAHNVVEVNGRQYALESDIAVRSFIHQVEAGAVKLENKIILLPNTEVVDYLSQVGGKVGLMCHYHSTREKLKHHLPHAEVYSSQAHSEGYDLSHLDHFIIVNTGYSGASHIQRIERTTNLNDTEDRVINHITTDYGISRAVLETVQGKEDFNLRLFRNLRHERIHHSKTHTG